MWCHKTVYLWERALLAIQGLTIVRLSRAGLVPTGVATQSQEAYLVFQALQLNSAWSIKK
ncbi:MAG: hypothetical protein A3H44_04970 [Gammaproteobacteria bacterium RIFCSPLOWO2_02_FULL_57_10]|nr:MAG: hypothetical protein A3H44_04970 [Gammaproteobacteria bacterium RIFCSPLOWO2_02_FULL_57_10]